MLRLGTGKSDLERAAKLLRAGELVAFPTETVYGLGADASNPDAVARIFEAKGRPADHPVIVHLPSAGLLQDWARNVPSAALRLADAFWPGPLTLVLERASGVSDLITGGQHTIGVRVPNHPVALALLRAFGGALAAPSANRFGRVSPTTADHVIAEFGDEVAAVIDAGPCQIGVESTIVDLTGDRPRLLRPGMIGNAALEAVLGETLERPGAGQGPRASGRLEWHYAPSAPVELVAPEALPARVEAVVRSGEHPVVLGWSGVPAGEAVTTIAMPRQPLQYARRLYAELRNADAQSPDCILVERPPETAGWDAIRDRLTRAAGKSDRG
ncbi:MAG: L-threonylcarbamoyladenylate synthase [Wenzhouxiangellaceae bacterium]|nr:L-threonylcarbamoyladenylate synthase [Wenzhouxiangellaceae bacterium]